MNEQGVNHTKASGMYIWSSMGCLVGLGLFAWLNAKDPNPVWSQCISGVLLLYTIGGLLDPSRSTNLLTRYGETVYFLGYLATIMVLAGLAWEIKGNDKLLEKVGDLIFKGGLAILSTVVGLIGMFVFRVMAQATEHHSVEDDTPNAPSAEMLLAIDEMSKKSREMLEQLSAQSHQVIDQMGQLGSKYAESMHNSLERMESMGGKIAQATETITERADDLGETLQGLQTIFVGCQTDMRKFSETAKSSEGLLLDTLEGIKKRASEVGSLAGGIKNFVDAAETISPALTTITTIMERLNSLSENLSALPPINDAVGTLGKSVQILNEALANSAGAMAKISTDSHTMSIATGFLVTEIHTQIAELKRVSIPKSFLTAMDELKLSVETVKNSISDVDKFAASIKANIDGLDTFAAGVKTNTGDLDKFAASISGIEASVKMLEVASQEAANQMKDLPKVIESFMELQKKLKMSR